jgi:Arc/MetJ family transcription regulator
MRTNIDLDEALVVRIRMATGLASKREIVAAALRYYAAALEEDPGARGEALGQEMRADVRARALARSPEERVAEALALGDQQIRLAARRSGIGLTEARRRHEAEVDATRRRG